MTARSFTEAFAQARADEAIRDDLPAHYFDCDKFRTYGYMNHSGDCDCTATADVESLLEKLHGAIRWAVTLEGQNAAALALHEGIHYGSPDERYCGTCVDEAGENAIAWPCPTVAALTGSTE